MAPSDPDRPAAVNQCVIALDRLKPDMDSLTAEALCGDLFERGVLGDGDDEELPLADEELEALADARSAQRDLDPEVEECVLSMKADNPDMDKSTMIAICKDMQNKGALEAYLDAGDEPDDAKALAQFRNPGDIQRVEEGGNTVRYKRVGTLYPGMWTDAGSEQTVNYSAEGIRASAENWIDMEAIRKQVPEWPQLSNEARAQRLDQLGDAVLTDQIPINFLHGPSMYGADSLDEVGHIPADSVIVDDQGRLYADYVLHGDTAQSQTTIELMDEVLEAANTPGAHTPPVGPSVEIPADRVTQSGDGALELQEAWFSGAGIVFNPASRPVELGAQATERAIAMSAADGTASGIVYRDAPAGDQTLKAALRHRWRMGQSDTDTTDDTGDVVPDLDDMSDDDLRRTLETMNEDFEEIKRALQDDDAMMAVLDAIQMYVADAGDVSAGADEFRDWAAANTDIDEALLDDVLSAYLEATGAETLDETPVDQLQAWLNEQAGGDDDGEAEEGDNPSDDEGANMEDLAAVKETLGEFADHMSDIKDMLQAAESARKERMEELERRLSSIEDEPTEDRALTGQRPDDFLTDPDGEDYEDDDEVAGPGALTL